MNRLQEIKDLIAQEAGYDDWKHLRTRVPLAYWDVYHDQAAEQYAREKQPKWIPVSERLPEMDEYVLVYTDNRVFNPTNHIISRYTKYGFESSNSVTHWMPLPEPPTQQNNNNH